MPGDMIQNPYHADLQLVCRSPPFGDFCYLSPMEHGGSTGWADVEPATDADTKRHLLTEVDCRNNGFFKRGDLYCATGSKYVWMCRNDENCNLVKPLDGSPAWKMWETWELIARQPKIYNMNELGFVEPSSEFLKKSFGSMPVRNGYTMAIDPMVLPISLADFHKIFIDDDAPYFMD